MENSILEMYGENLTANKYIVNPAVARDKELKELVMVLLTPEKSACLWGLTSVTFTALFRIIPVLRRLVKDKMHIPGQNHEGAAEKWLTSMLYGFTIGFCGRRPTLRRGKGPGD